MRKLKNLVLIDDDEIFTYLTKKTIDQSELVETLKIFNNGKYGIDFIKRCVVDKTDLPDVILLDLSMPIMDGWNFLEEFAKVKTVKKIKIYICSSSISPQDVDRAKTYGIDYIVKPITKDKFREIVNKLFA